MQVQAQAPAQGGGPLHIDGGGRGALGAGQASGCGAVTFVQRFGSLLNLNCHVHALLPDGVFVANPDGTAVFHTLPPPWDDDVTTLLHQIARAIHRLVEGHLARRSGDDDPPELLASEQARAVATPPVPGRALLPPPGRRCAFLEGYSLHAERLVDAATRTPCAGIRRALFRAR